MDIVQILHGILAIFKDTYMTHFQQKMIKMINQMIEYIERDAAINPFDMISNHLNREDRYIIEGLKQYLIANQKDYWVYIANSISAYDRSHQFIYRKIIMDLSTYPNAMNNLLIHLYASEREDLNALLERIPIIETNGGNEVYVLISHKSLGERQGHHIIRSVDSLHVLLGRESLKFLNHHNLDRFLSYWASARPDVIKSVNVFRDVYKLFHSIPYAQTRRLMLFSGFILHSLGTTYTQDADIMYWMPDASPDMVSDIKKLLNYKFYDDHYINNTFSNVKYLGTMFTDPTKHFYFMGIKMISIESTLYRTCNRVSTGSFVDALMLRRFNNIYIHKCIPPISVANNVIIYDDQQIIKLFKLVIKSAKEWHGFDIQHNELYRLIKKCGKYENMYRIKYNIGHTKLTLKIEKYMENLVIKKLRQYKMKNTLCINNHVTDYTFAKVDSDIRMTLITDDQNIQGNNYDSIVLNHVGDKLLFDRIKKMSSKIIIFIYPNPKYFEGITKKNNYELKLHNKILFGIYRYDEQSCLVYLRDSYTYAYGKKFNISDPLKDIPHRWRVIENKPMIHDMANNDIYQRILRKFHLAVIKC